MPRDAEDPSPDQLLAEIRSQAAANALEKASERLASQTNYVFKLRIEFFDRVVLLDGGTISLSFTLIGLLHRSANTSTQCHLFLFCAWVFFVISMVLAMLRNWQEHDRLMSSEWAAYSLVVHEYFTSFVGQVESLGVSTSDSNAEDVLRQGPALIQQQQAKHADLDKRTKLIGASALICTVFGYVMLLLFAILNAQALL